MINSDNPIVPVGGVAEVMKAVMKFWNVDGGADELNVISFGGADFIYDETNKVHHKIVRYDSVQNVQYSTYRSLFIQANLFRTALEFPKPDIVITTDWNCAIAGKQLALHYNIPYIFWSHLSPNSYCIPDSQGHIRVEKIIEAQGLELADGILHVSENYAKKFPFSAFSEKTTVIHNGIDPEDFRYKDSVNPYFHKDKWNLLYLGRPVRQKGIDFLLEARLPEGCVLNFALADNKGLAALGTNNIAKKVADADPDKYQFLGDIRGKIKSNYLNWADAMIIPSITEPFGIVGLEGLASRAIIISTLVEGLGNYMDDSCAVRIAVSTQGVEDGIVRAMQLPEEQKEEMRSIGSEVASAHDWRVIVKEIKEYLKKYIR